MKAPSTLVLPIVVAMITMAHLSKASEVDDILKEIGGGAKSTTSSSGGQNTTLKKTSSDSDSSNSGSSSSGEPASTPKPRKKHVASQSVPHQQTPPQPTIQVWSPRDKLPKEVTGQGVAGNFVIQGSSSDGTLILIPAEDASNPFARQYWVVNRTYGSGVPNVLVPMGQRELVQIPVNQPLIFIGRGILPGVYNVQAQ